jgi:RNA-binding protein
MDLEQRTLPGFQRKYLRGVAHDRKPVVLVGKEGLTDQLIEAVEQALTSHELIKVKLTRPEDKKAMAGELARRVQAELCGLIGHMVVLYRPHAEEPQIVLPQRAGALDD